MYISTRSFARPVVDACQMIQMVAGVITAAAFAIEGVQQICKAVRPHLSGVGASVGKMASGAWDNVPFRGSAARTTTTQMTPNEIDRVYQTGTPARAGTHEGQPGFFIGDRFYAFAASTPAKAESAELPHTIYVGEEEKTS